MPYRNDFDYAFLYFFTVYDFLITTSNIFYATLKK